MLLCVGAAAVATLVRYPAAIFDLNDLARRNAAQSYTDREIAGGNSVIPSQQLMYEARARIPEDETYEVVVGEPLEGWSDLTSDHAAGFARYFLFPRRSAPGAPWLLCLNCGLDGTGEVVWRDEEVGVSIVRRPG